MTGNEKVLNGFNKSRIFVRRWVPEGEIKAGLHILHGLAEHSARYDDYARYMNRHGYVVWCHDHRQHGESITHDSFGVFDEKDTWEAIVEDVAAVQNDFKKTYSDIPMFMLGHSMGSLILRSYVQMHPTELDGIILMGSPTASMLLAKAGVILSQIVEQFKPGKPSPFLDKMAIDSYSRSVRNARTSSDWLSYDQIAVDRYIEDPYSCFIYSPLFYKELSVGALTANNQMMMKAFPKIPTLFISGEEDPCGQNGKGVLRLSEIYSTLGVENELVIMEGMRHEVLNEVERRTTFKVLRDWLDNAI